MKGDRPPVFTDWSPLRPAVLSHPRRHAPQPAPQIGPAPAGPSAPGHPAPLGAGVVDRARAMAEQLLSTVEDGGRRWRHTRSVAARAAEAAAAVAPEQLDLLLSAAWLHDIGYAPALVETGFHPLDGARHLQRELWPPAVVGLVAHHSGSRFVAALRGVQHLMEPFDGAGHWSGPVADALTWADQTTGPDGGRVDVHDRLEEVLGRHGPTSPQARCHPQRGPALIAAVRATEARLAEAGRTAVPSR